MFKTIGPLEIGLIVFIILILFGAGKLPQVGAAMGKGIRAFRRGQSGEDEIVDDDEDLRDSVAAILEGQDYLVSTAGDREEGMEKMRSEKPDLLLLDVMMSAWQDGFEMAREIKGDPELKDVPILMLTGVKEKTGIDFKSAAGDETWCPVDGFLEKPVQPEVLLEQIEKLLS